MANITQPDVIRHSEPFQITLNGTVSRGEPIGQNGTNWVRADADGGIPCRAFALAAGVSGDVIQACKSYVGQTTTDMSIGAPVFLSATAGRIDDANPGAAATVVQVIGWVMQGAGTEEVHLDADIPHYEVNFSLAGTTPATAANYEAFYTCNRRLRYLGSRSAHRVAGTDAGAVTLDFRKLASGDALGAGVVMGAATHDLKSTINTPTWAGPTATVANARLTAGDRIEAVDAGTLTDVAGVTATLYFVADIQ